MREWLDDQAASGYVDYDPGSGRYALTAEQAAAFADEAGGISPRPDSPDPEMDR